MNRPSRIEVHLATACMWAERSVCSRLCVGCVITTCDHRRVLSVGYNGPAKGLDHGRCNGLPGGCGCLHAEDNAIAMVDGTIPDKTAFLTHSPCITCAQRLIQAKVTTVWFVQQYRSAAGLDLLRAVGVLVDQYEPNVLSGRNSPISRGVLLHWMSRPTD